MPEGAQLFAIGSYNQQDFNRPAGFIFSSLIGADIVAGLPITTARLDERGRISAELYDKVIESNSLPQNSLINRQALLNAGKQTVGNEAFVLDLLSKTETITGMVSNNEYIEKFWEEAGFSGVPLERSLREQLDPIFSDEDDSFPMVVTFASGSNGLGLSYTIVMKDRKFFFVNTHQTALFRNSHVLSFVDKDLFLNYLVSFKPSDRYQIDPIHYKIERIKLPTKVSEAQDEPEKVNIVTICIKKNFLIFCSSGERRKTGST